MNKVDRYWVNKNKYLNKIFFVFGNFDFLRRIVLYINFKCYCLVINIKNLIYFMLKRFFLYKVIFFVFCVLGVLFIGD